MLNNKFKTFMKNQFECLNVNGMTHFDLAVHVRLFRRYSTFVMRKNYTFLMCSIHKKNNLPSKDELRSF